VQRARGGFALLDNRSGHFSALGQPLHSPQGSGYRASLVGDLDNDGFDDVIVLGEKDSRVFKFYAHGRIRDATHAAGLDGLRATSGVLADLDFTGNLDLVAVRPGEAGLAASEATQAFRRRFRAPSKWPWRTGAMKACRGFSSRDRVSPRRSLRKSVPAHSRRAA
jgi:hypothetical protein